LSPNVEASKTAGEELKSDEVFGMMHTYLAEGNGKELVPKV